MLNDSVNILGCSFDGLLDVCYSSENKKWDHASFCLSDVVFPLSHAGELLAGPGAETSRVDSGLSWPPEARIDGSRPLRRLPIPIAWRLLTDAQDREARWNIGKGINFSVAKALAAHISENLKNKSAKETGEMVLAIPNFLDEYGQEALLRELTFSGIGSLKNKPKLIWRPVAAALAWLDKVQKDFEAIGKDDFILVVYVGADAVELTCFKLRTRFYDGIRYIIPLREPPKKNVKYGGYDWAAEIISSLVGEADFGGFWQAFTGFPEIWMALAGKNWNQNDLPRIWNCDSKWTLWNPDSGLRENAGRFQVKSSRILNSILEQSSRQDSNSSPGLGWYEFLASELSETLQAHAGTLRGVILTGPLASINLANYLTPKIGIKDLSPLNQPKIEGFWFSESDVISEGAAIYGARLASGKPTYLDTLTQLYLYANKRGNHQWVPLLREQELEVLGGSKHRNTLPRSFQLNEGSRDLQVILRKGDSNKFKKADFRFPNAPQENVSLDLQILMSPASGLAQLEFIPEKKEFIGNRRVFLDYSLMQDTTELPEKGFGFPDIIDHTVDPEDRAFEKQDFIEICNKFLHSQVVDKNYQDRLEGIRNIIKLPVSYFDQSSHSWINTRLVNKDGKPSKPENESLLNEIVRKLENDFIGITKKQMNQNEKTTKFLWQTGTWLFGSAPQPIKDYVCTVLQSATSRPSVYLIEAAGRSFTEPLQIRPLYSAIYRGIRERLEEDHAAPFPIQYMRALWNVLQFREYAPDALDRPHVALFVRQVIKLMEECVQAKNYKVKFFQAIRLFIFLLRYRIVDGTFLTEDNAEDRPLFKLAIKFLEQSKSYFSKQKQNKKSAAAQHLMEEIEKYMIYKGTENIVSVLNEASGDDEDENGETD